VRAKAIPIKILFITVFLLKGPRMIDILSASSSSSGLKQVTKPKRPPLCEAAFVRVLTDA
jgi:hypothetical protein